MPRVFLLGRRPKPALLFLIAEKDPAGRTLQAAPCGRPLQKASTPSRRPQDKPILSRAFYNLFIRGCAPYPPYFFHCKKDPAGRFCKKASTPSRRPQDKFIFIRAFYNLSFLGRRPKPALLFLIAEKEGKKASPLGTYKTYFEPGVL